MDPAEALTTHFAGALADLGLRHVVMSPGSRNTSLLTAFASEQRIEAHMMLDERSAGFLALGMAKQSGVPVALVCTSGTAAANYFPSVVEARHARVPLIVLTADRPPELRGVDAPQTIDQINLYGTNVRRFHDVGVPDDDVADAAPSLALMAWSAALDSPQGPVHLNFPFREPLAVAGEPAAPTMLRYHRGDVQLPPEDLAELAERVSDRRAAIVVGGHQRSGFAAAAAMFAGEADIPVVADIQCRFPSRSTIAYGDLLATAGFFETHEPDLVIRIGPVSTSRPIWTWLKGTDAEQIMIDDAGWRDPLGTVARAYRADPAVTLADLAGRVTPAPAPWLEHWRDADRVVDNAVIAALQSETFPNEPAVARLVAEATPSGATIYVGSSMPVRDLDTFSGNPRGDVMVLANRGANGIDGLLSTAAGAAASDGRRVVVLAGDVSVLHDATALGTISRLNLPVTVVAVNNDGGGIFHFLPQAHDLDPERFETLFGTPHGHSLLSIAEAFGVPARSVDTEAALRKTLMEATGPTFIEIRTDRSENRDVHARIGDAVRRAVNA